MIPEVLIIEGKDFLKHSTLKKCLEAQAIVTDYKELTLHKLYENLKEREEKYPRTFKSGLTAKTFIFVEDLTEIS